MRVALGAMMSFMALAWSGAAHTQEVCTNIRLSVSEQIECRGRLTNALGDTDRLRIQQEFEDRIRRANDQLIMPSPVLRSQPPPSTSGVARSLPPAVPAPPTAPSAPKVPGSLTALPSSAARPTEGLSPSGNAIAPDLTAPGPVSPLPPISPLPRNPAGSLAPPN